MRRTIFREEHEDFRWLIRSFLEREIVPVHRQWEVEGRPPRRIFQMLGELGVMGINMPAEWGGAGLDDYVYNVVLQEETARVGVTIGSLRTHLDVILPYFRRYASLDQQERWFPGISTGDLMTSIALTEPDTGSDLAGVRTSAVLDGDHYVLNGAKTYITGGDVADLIIVLCRTSSHDADRREGLTLLVVEDGMPGFAKGAKLEKLGLKTQDTVELFFSDVAVPVGNRLGEPGQAFRYLSEGLPQERLAIAVGSVTQARAAFELTVDHVKNRRMFGTSLSTFQNTKFELSAVATEIEAAQAFLDAGITELTAGRLEPADAAKVKLFCTEVQGRVVDRCLQLFGGFGYITEAPIARLYADARVSRIYGGSSEVMKLIISKSIGL
jgi:acyl-CoA dehydrogenase